MRASMLLACFRRMEPIRGQTREAALVTIGTVVGTHNLPCHGNVFGGVWPWWNGNVVVASYADGHAKAVQLNSLTAECNVQAGWGGYITDKSKYNWSTTF
jgi:hypothetical protein